MDTFFKNNNVENNITSYRGSYVASTRTYSFGNIAKLLKTHIENSPDEDLEINVIPVQRRVGTTTNYYGQTSEYTVQSIEELFETFRCKTTYRQRRNGNAYRNN